MGPNIFAYFMLVVWPLITAQFFKKYKLETAIILSFVVSYLLLPNKTVIDLPLIPPLDKFSIPVFTVVFLLYNNAKANKFKPNSKIIWLFLIGFIVSPFMTFITNQSALVVGQKYIPGLGFRDFLSMLVENFTRFYFPFFIGAMFLGSSESSKRIIRLLVGATIIYSVLMLWEIRMSPQLHKHIYGFTSQWGQQIRQGGFRPTVFLGHGLLVAMLAAQGFVGSLIILRGKGGKLFGLQLLIWSAYLFLIVVLCKTLAALVYAILFGLFVMLLNQKNLLRLSLLVSMLVLLYPGIKHYFVPTDWVLEKAYNYDVQRGQSLKFRFVNEDILLSKANEKAMFGWGGWGRGFIYNPKNGAKTTTADGAWIIIFGSDGWFGYLLKFGLPFIAVYSIYRVKDGGLKDHRNTENINISTAGLVVLLAMNLIDLIPNSSLTPLTYLIAGSIWGTAQKLIEKSRIETDSLQKS